MRFFVTSCLLFLWIFSGYSQPDQPYVVGDVEFVGNEKTKLFVLHRELTFQEDDTVTMGEFSEKLVRSEENLFNTRLFISVSSTVSVIDSSTIHVKFLLEERWYLWPYPILENADRNFNTWWQTKDFQRLTYGVFLNAYNFRGRNETLQFMLKVGFENQFSMGYNIPNLNKKKTLGLYMAGGYSEFQEVNYSSLGNKRLFYKAQDGAGRQVAFGKINLTYRKGLNFRHTLGLAYTQIKVDSAVLDLSNDYLKNNRQETNYFSLHYNGRYDTRDYIDYPLIGYKLELFVSEYGLGILSNENLRLLTTSGGVNWHRQLSDRWFVANSIFGKLSFFDNPPYSIQQGLGFQNTIRGYELYVMDAQNYGIVKTNVKFNLLKKRSFQLDWIPLKKFRKPFLSIFVNTYFDFGYADDTLYANQNQLSNQWAYGYGIGLDFVSFYDFVMRTEISLNRENEAGFFLHFKKSI
jgi:outer membrane protein assembly factor BamA